MTIEFDNMQIVSVEEKDEDGEMQSKWKMMIQFVINGDKTKVFSYNPTDEEAAEFVHNMEFRTKELMKKGQRSIISDFQDRIGELSEGLDD